MHIKKLITLFLVLFVLCSCSATTETKIMKTKWYTDDINKTVRTVAHFGTDGRLTVNYVLLDEARAERVGLADIQNTQDEYYFYDYDSSLPEDIAKVAEDECAFVTYSTPEDYKNKENGAITFYHYEGDNLVVNSTVCLPVDEALSLELDKKIGQTQKLAD